MQTQSTARFTEKISDHFKEIEPSLQPHLPATSQKVPLEYMAILANGSSKLKSEENFKKTMTFKFLT